LQSHPLDGEFVVVMSQKSVLPPGDVKDSNGNFRNETGGTDFDIVYSMISPSLSPSKAPTVFPTTTVPSHSPTVMIHPLVAPETQAGIIGGVVGFGLAFLVLALIIGGFKRVSNMKKNKLVQEQVRNFFLSHHNNTSQEMEVFAAKLREKKYSVWIDKSEIAEYENMIYGAQRCGVFILYLSSKALERPAVRMELVIALASKRPIVVLYDAIAIKTIDVEVIKSVTNADEIFTRLIQNITTLRMVKFESNNPDIMRSAREQVIEIFDQRQIIIKNQRDQLDHFILTFGKDAIENVISQKKAELKSNDELPWMKLARKIVEERINELGRNQVV
jgi:hypothetical protein